MDFLCWRPRRRSDSPSRRRLRTWRTLRKKRCRYDFCDRIWGSLSIYSRDKSSLSGCIRLLTQSHISSGGALCWHSEICFWSCGTPAQCRPLFSVSFEIPFRSTWSHILFSSRSWFSTAFHPHRSPLRRWRRSCKPTLPYRSQICTCRGHWGRRGLLVTDSIFSHPRTLWSGICRIAQTDSLLLSEL